MLHPFPNFSDPQRVADERYDTLRSCQKLKKSGAVIEPGMDLRIADALFSREMGYVDLVLAAVTLLHANPRVVSILDLAWQKDEQALDALLADGTLVAFLNTPLIQALLYSSPIPDLAMERLLTHVRRRLLACAIDQTWRSDTFTMSAVAALSAHSFLTEYVFEETQTESDLVTNLQNRLESHSAADIDPFDLVLLGCYRALGDLESAQKIEDALIVNSDSILKALWRIQVSEPEHERHLQGGIQRISEINDATSRAVRSLYEENPYPRWVCYPRNNPKPPQTVLSEWYGGVDLEAFGAPNSVDILVAGCGTGQAAILEAAMWRDSTVYAVDLSLASLSYGQRCAEEIGLSSIEFVQGDILELSSMDRKFDYISCVGVLHHMADPLAGWTVLSNACRPGGVMLIGLYGEIMRKSIAAGSSFLKGFTAGNTPEAIRKARQTLIDHAHESGERDETYNSIFNTFDFYDLSMCRDLLFHVQEVDFSIPMIESALKQLGLKFCGFSGVGDDAIQKYRTFAPHDLMGTDLASWEEFEIQNPELFKGMYNFIVQKPVAS